MFDLRAPVFPTVLRITGRRRLVIYGLVILVASIVFWHLVHEEHIQHALHDTGSSDVTVDVN